MIWGHLCLGPWIWGQPYLGSSLFGVIVIWGHHYDLVLSLFGVVVIWGHLYVATSAFGVVEIWGHLYLGHLSLRPSLGFRAIIGIWGHLY